METQAVEMIRLMLQRTREGKIQWSKADHDAWEGHADGRMFNVEFIFLARTDDVGSDRTLARISAFGLLHDYCIGTEGFDLICEMLSVNDEEWTRGRQRGQQKYEAGMNFLRQL